MLVDTLGHLLALRVAAANDQDRAQVGALAEQVQAVTGETVDLVYVDQNYARISLLIGVLAAGIAMVIGTGVGMLAGYYRGAAGVLLMRFVDVVLVIPFVPLMVLLAAYLGQTLWNLLL